MKHPVKIHVLMLTLLAIGCFFVVPNVGAAPVAKITSYEGDVTVLSGTDRSVISVSQSGHPLNPGDMVQTGQGKATATFNDGATLEVSPFSSSMIQEYEESSGFWPFSTKKAVRRITVFVGKLFFKSGASNRQNFLQTPTAVCALRGTSVGVSHDLFKSLLYVAEGQVEGQQGFQESQTPLAEIVDAYRDSPVYQIFLQALQGQVGALEAIQKAINTLLENPNLSTAARNYLTEVLKAVDGALGIVTPPSPTSSTETTTTTTTTSSTTTTTTTTTTVSPTTSTTTTTTTPPIILPPGPKPSPGMPDGGY